MNNTIADIKRPFLRSERSGKPLGLIAVTLLLCCFMPQSIKAAAGDLDLTFGMGGKVITDFGAILLAGASINDLALQPDGKIVAAGIFQKGDFDRDLALARYNTDGSLDQTFGTGGRVVTDMGFASVSVLDTAVVIQSDGKILVAISGGVVFPIRLVRYNTDGSLDPSFGSGGMLLTDVRGALPPQLAIQPDGKIVVLGVALSGFFTDLLVARYNPDGSPDLTFGIGGKTITDFYGFSDFPRTIFLQPDGRILVGGRGDRFNFGSDFILARYESSGMPDLTFGAGGKVSTDFLGGDDEILKLNVTPGGKIIAAGTARPPGSFRGMLALARYDANGNLDPAFGIGGKLTGPVPDDLTPPIDIAFQPDGKIIAMSIAFRIFQDFSITRYTPDAAIDLSFGSGGVASTDFEGGFETASAVVIQPDGKIIVGGAADVGLNSHFGLVRYEGDSPEFGSCIQDESNDRLMEINLSTGEYRFSNCSGFTLGGTGSLIKKGGNITLQHNSSDRRILVRIDTVANKATAFIQLFSQGTFLISDRNINNNTCSCVR